MNSSTWTESKVSEVGDTVVKVSIKGSQVRDVTCSSPSQVGAIHRLENPAIESLIECAQQWAERLKRAKLNARREVRAFLAVRKNLETLYWVAITHDRRVRERRNMWIHSDANVHSRNKLHKQEHCVTCTFMLQRHNGTNVQEASIVALRVCLHALDVYPLRIGRSPMPWARLLRESPAASKRLRIPLSGEEAVREFAFSSDHPSFLGRAFRMEGVFHPATRTILVKTDTLGDDPQRNVLVVMHEMAHALLHWERALLGYYAEPDMYAEMETQAELVAITAVYLMGYQLPAKTFEMLHDLKGRSAHVYAALVDSQFDDIILPAAEAIVAAFTEP